ncbi:MAG: DUF2180 family protein [Ardenticatenaceae bacterium]|nr:DUF2180 family protein [Ardenticatenaceae bacterium]HBY97006.1 hypothetical protein [Chloroflexota bacterium]
MKCYVCAKTGETMDAVAVCAICGMGLCLDHAIEREIPLVQRVSGWASQSTMHILCKQCSKVLGLTG